jgi:hypothetical protein
MPAVRHHHHRREQLGHRRADVAGAEDAQRGALLFLREPLGDIGDAHRERTAGDAHRQRRQQELRIGLGVGQHPGGAGTGQHHQAEHDAAAVLFGPHAQEQADQGAGEDRGGHQQAELGIAQAQVLLDLDADDRKDRPHREAHGEGEGAAPQGQVLLALGRNGGYGAHG